MADINIENFYRHIATIFNILYRNFPTKVAIYVDEVAGIDEPDEYGLHSPNYTAGFFALLWLADEGYIRYSDAIRQDGIDQATLSHKGFLRLTQISEPIYHPPESDSSSDSNVVKLKENENLSPSLVEDQKLIINQLRHALHSGSSIATTKIVQYILRHTA
ncbi:MAG: hypothetical protein KUG79_05395 [Pseudomonadales bacterium]|nr:hypothetical protein [Pseudomonadales bacterium]